MRYTNLKVNTKKKASPQEAGGGGGGAHFLVFCKKCQLQYIGLTTTKFKVRFRNHKSFMITKKSCEVAVHFNSITHSLQDCSFQCIDQSIDTKRKDGIDKPLVTKEAH